MALQPLAQQPIRRSRGLAALAPQEPRQSAGRWPRRRCRRCSYQRRQPCSCRRGRERDSGLIRRSHQGTRHPICYPAQSRIRAAVLAGRRQWWRKPGGTLMATRLPVRRVSRQPARVPSCAGQPLRHPHMVSTRGLWDLALKPWNISQRR